MKEVSVFAPNTVSNVGCGYDVLGFALECIGDEVTVKRRNDSKLVIIPSGDSNLPLDPDKNVAGVAIRSLLDSLDNNSGFDITIKKGISPGSGLGSSACSSAGAVFAVNTLLDHPYSTTELVPFAMEGERSSSGQSHADNVAPSLLGGFVAIRSYHPLDIIPINYPTELLAVVIYPQVEVKTAYAKKILPQKIAIEDAVQQWGNMAGLITGFAQNDVDLISRSLEDKVAEPVRKTLIPHYDEIKTAAIGAGAIGFNISGSGPSTFALVNDRSDAERIKKLCLDIYEKHGIESIGFVSPVNPHGTEIL